MKSKKAGIISTIGWIVFSLAISLLVMIYLNDMNFSDTVQQIIGWFGKK